MSATLTTFVLDTGNQTLLDATLNSLEQQVPVRSTIKVVTAHGVNQCSEPCAMDALNEAIAADDCEYFNILFAGDTVAASLTQKVLDAFKSEPGVNIISTACHWHDANLDAIGSPLPNLFGVGPLVSRDPLPGPTVIAESLSPVLNRIGQLSSCAFRRTAKMTARFQPRRLTVLAFLFDHVCSGSYRFVNEDLVGILAEPSTTASEQEVASLAADVFALIHQWKDIAGGQAAIETYNIHALAMAHDVAAWHRDSQRLLEQSCPKYRAQSQAATPAQLEQLFKASLQVLATDPQNTREALWSVREYKRENAKLLEQIEATRQAYEEQIRQLHVQLSSMVSSYSWRVTVPFRALARGFKRHRPKSTEGSIK